METPGGHWSLARRGLGEKWRGRLAQEGLKRRVLAGKERDQPKGYCEGSNGGGESPIYMGYRNPQLKGASRKKKNTQQKRHDE